MVNKLLLVGGDMVLRFNQPLTEKEKNKLIKTYSAIGWGLNYYDAKSCSIAFVRFQKVNVKLPKHSDY